ncbi:MAG TPA: Type 1 glutamine amidotransferase-like domain-containing protein [Candidatus Kapabacteria bacterium]|jgi:dipeptidase E
MILYLSSYRIGNESVKLKGMIPEGLSLGFVPNALDHVAGAAWNESNAKHIKDLTDLGITVEMLDLRDYFGRKSELIRELDRLGGIWVRGGNTFVLRHAMQLSGLDEILKEMRRPEFLYGGFSAGGCVLGPTLKCLQIVDEPNVNPYNSSAPIWEGLSILDYTLLPHYRSDHPESEAIEKEVEYCHVHSIPFKTLRDGEVVITEA